MNFDTQCEIFLKLREEMMNPRDTIILSAISVVLVCSNVEFVSGETFCEEYANTAVRESAAFRSHACGDTSGERWHENVDRHEQWCLEMGEARAEADAAARQEEIEKCVIVDLKVSIDRIQFSRSIKNSEPDISMGIWYSVENLGESEFRIDTSPEGARVDPRRAYIITYHAVFDDAADGDRSLFTIEDRMINAVPNSLPPVHSVRHTLSPVTRGAGQRTIYSSHAEPSGQIHVTDIPGGLTGFLLTARIIYFSGGGSRCFEIARTVQSWEWAEGTSPNGVTRFTPTAGSTDFRTNFNYETELTNEPDGCNLQFLAR
jgi:hypothetical protein